MPAPSPSKLFCSQGSRWKALHCFGHMCRQSIHTETGSAILDAMVRSGQAAVHSSMMATSVRTPAKH